MFVITGATGQLGGAIVERLLERVEPQRVAVSVRDPSKAQALADRGVRVRRGDYTDPAGLAEAFEGAEQVLLVSASTHGEAARRQHGAAIAAARDAGAGRILYTSHQGASPTSAFAPMRDHAATEELLAGSGIAWTSLRNGFYASTAQLFVGRALDSGTLVAPADGPVSWTTHADLAEAAVRVLLDGGFDGPTPALTGSEALDLADVAGIAAELTGRPLARAVSHDADFRAGLVARGTPDDVADLFLGMFAASRAGEFATVDPTLARLLDRPPTSLRDLLAPALQH